MEIFLKCLFAVAAASVTMTTILLILLELSWRNKDKPKPFKISKEVDYIMSRGVKTI